MGGVKRMIFEFFAKWLVPPRPSYEEGDHSAIVIKLF